jgi:peptidoglycan/xylan/chitin deacetylase (PgdA/CDA1 family)
VGGAKAVGKALVGGLLYRSGLLDWYRDRAAPMGPRILYYHRVVEAVGPYDLGLSVSVANFERQIAHLTARYDVLPLETLLDRVAAGERLSPRALALTFDDGYRDNYTLAWPVLARHRCPATVFVTTGHVGGSRLFWWDRVVSLVVRADAAAVRTLVEDPGLPGDLRRAIAELAGRRSGAAAASLVGGLKRAGRSAREAALALIEARLARPEFDTGRGRVFLSWDEIRAMAAGGITFGSHTHSHRVLPELTPEEAEEELAVSKRLIEENVGIPVRMLAYPDGCFAGPVKALARRLGYVYGLQTRRDFEGSEVDPYAIPRIRIAENHCLGALGRFSAAVFALEVSEIPNSLLLRDLRRLSPYPHLRSNGGRGKGRRGPPAPRTSSGGESWL